MLDVAVKLLKQRDVDLDLADAAARRRRRPTRCWPRATWSACSRWKARACGGRWSTCGPTGSRTSSRWSRSTGRARWRTSRPIARASTARRRPNILHPTLEPILKETFGVITYQEQVHADRQGSGRLYARRGRPAAPRHGQEDQAPRWTRSARVFLVGRGRARHAERRTRDRDLRAAAPSSPNTASTRSHAAPYALRHLSDRLYEGEPPGRIPGGVDDARYRQHRQALANFAPKRSGSGSRSRRPRSTVPARPSRSATAPSITRWRA